MGKRKGGYRIYDLPFILQTLSALILNDNDMQKTAVEADVSVDSISRWVKKYSVEYKEQIHALSVGRSSVDVSDTMELYRESTTSEIEKVKDMIIMRMKDVVPKTKNLDQLSRAYKIIHDCINGIQDGSIPNDKSFMQIFNMQINGMQKENIEETKDIDYEPTEN